MTDREFRIALVTALVLLIVGTAMALHIQDNNNRADAEFRDFLISTNPRPSGPLHTERPKWNSGLTIEDYDPDFEKRYFRTLTPQQKEELRARVTAKRQQEEAQRSQKLREILQPR